MASVDALQAIKLMINKVAPYGCLICRTSGTIFTLRRWKGPVQGSSVWISGRNVPPYTTDDDPASDFWTIRMVQ